MDQWTPWLMLLALGAYHGVNPAMGWLFAVALGLQERSRAAVVRALGPIAVGHALSIALVVALAAVLGVLIDPGLLRLGGVVVLVGFGIYKLLVPTSHPRWVGMRVSQRDLVVWSFLMATAHGAGLMLVPVVLEVSESTATGGHAGHAAMSGTATGLPITEVMTVLVHSAALFAVMGVIAVGVYQKLGVAIVRRAWFNLDRVWATMLIAAGGLTLVL